MPEEKIPLGQRFYDSIFILFILSQLVTLFSFDIWGVLDLRLVPWVK